MALIRSVRRFLLVALALLVAGVHPSAEPSYTRLKLFELALLSEIVVSGEISKLEETHFELAVAEVIVGDPTLRSLRVRRFGNWTCAGRWTKYAVGQRIVLCARNWSEAPDQPRELHVLGAGDEGEMPFVGERVVVENSNGYRVQGFPEQKHQAAGAEITGAAIPYRELATALRSFRTLCSWESDRDGWRVRSVGPSAGIEPLEMLAQSSPVALHLVDEARSSDAWKAPGGSAATTLEARALRGLASIEHGFAGRARLAPGQEPGEFDRTVRTGFGAASAWIGDVDGDGLGELAVGAPSDRAFTGHGIVWLLRFDERQALRSRVELRLPTAPPPWERARPADWGQALAPLGDLDGDGVPELAVGAYQWSSPEQLGAVWVLFLKRDGSVARALELGSQEPLRVAGVGPWSGFGRSLTPLGDLDGDGTVELAIGQEPSWFMASVLRAPRPFEFDHSVFVVSLARDGAVRRVCRIGSAELGFELDGWFGNSLAAIGDLDADGVNDLAIGNSYDADGGELRGAVWIAFLTKDGGVKSKQKISDWKGNFSGALGDGAAFGSALSAPGDLDGDGILDLLVASDDALWSLLLRRDGTVRAHQQLVIVNGSELPSLGRWSSIACTPGGAGAARTRIALFGDLARPDGEESALWWFSAKPDGTLAAW